MKVRTAIVLPDMQVPYEDKRTLKAVEKFMATRKWDYYINLGDFMDLESLSHFSKGNAKALASQDVEADFEAGRKILTRHEAIVRSGNPEAVMVLLEGNHCQRVGRFCEEVPQLRTILDVERNLRLKELGIRWIRRTGKPFKIGNAYFVHGRWINEFHGKKHAMRYGVNIFYGHSHDVQCYSMVLHGKDKTVVGQSLGCLCRYDQQYIRGNPTNWQQAFAVFYFLPDGYFTYNVVRIFKHRFIVEGRVYSG